VSLRYLPEYAEASVLALQLAEKEASYLAYTNRTLFSQQIDLPWVKKLEKREDLAEKIDAFVSRFARLQDHIGEKLIPRFASLLGESPKSFLDVLAYAERVGWIDSAEEFIGARKLRNLLVHEYMSNPELFLEALLSADRATHQLIEIVNRMRLQAQSISLIAE
jgi:uncharacterized protein YutE (UPF0331/DUF86 family)